MDQFYPFSLPPLPYDYEALEPEISARTLHFHHDKHFAAYVDKLNQLLETHPTLQSRPLEQLIRDWCGLPEDIRQDIRNNAGGVYNHDLYFSALAPGPATSSQAPLEGAILRDFGSLPALKSAMKTAALAQFGSGYAWLTADREGGLSVCRTANQDVPFPLTPLLCCDVWEHAYYLQYQNRRADYFEAWWRQVNWPMVSRLYGQCQDARPRYPQG